MSKNKANLEIIRKNFMKENGKNAKFFCRYCYVYVNRKDDSYHNFTEHGFEKELRGSHDKFILMTENLLWLL